MTARFAPLALVLALATSAAHAGTVLEYDVTGTCATEFTRMQFDGLNARIDQSMDGSDMSTLFDDSEQLAHMLMHDTRNVMTMESDDDAIDFQSDVGKSTLHFAGNRTRALTGMDNNQMMEQARAMQVAMCPEMADMGFADPDYADAAARCAERMQQQAQAAQGRRPDMVAAMAAARSGRGDMPHGLVVPRAEAPATAQTWSTTTTDRYGGEETIGGLGCRVETMRRGDVVLREQCVTEVEKLALDASAMRRIKRIVAIGQGMGEGISQVYPDMDPDRDQPASLPLRRTCYAGGRQTGTATLQVRRNVDLPADTFAIPEGYTAFDATMPEDIEQLDAIDLDRLMQQRR